VIFKTGCPTIIPNYSNIIRKLSNYSRLYFALSLKTEYKTYINKIYNII